MMGTSHSDGVSQAAGEQSKPTVLFVCVHNAGKSQMAAAIMRQLAGELVDVRSAGTDPDADLSGFITPLDTLWEMVANRDMPDEVLAKLCKACAFARRASTDPETQGASLKLLRQAMHLNPNAGVKREIAALTRALKKVQDAGSDVATTTESDAAAEKKEPAKTKASRAPRKTTTGKASAARKSTKK